MLSSALHVVRSGEWLEGARRRRIATLLAIFYAASGAYLLSSGDHLDPLGRAIGSDFSAFYGVSRALLHGTPASALYSPQVLNDAIGDLTGGRAYVWLYPATAMLAYWPLAKLPYLVALAAWLAVGIAAYAAAVWAVLPRWRVLAPAALFPAVYACVVHGHNGLLTAGLLGGGVVLATTRPVAAGALLAAVAMIKPHLAMLVPIALVAGRRWRTLAAAIAAAALLAALAALAFGPDVWAAYLRSLPLSRAMLESEGVPYAKIGSVFAAARLLGGSVVAAYAAQGLAAAVAAAVTFRAWARPGDADVDAAVLLSATALATPYLYDYDLPFLGVALAAWARAALRTGWRPWEKSMMFAVWTAPFLIRPVAFATRVGVLPVVVVAALGLLWARRRGAPPVSATEAARTG